MIVVRFPSALTFDDRACLNGTVGRPHWLLAVPSPLSRSDDGTHFLSEGGATALRSLRATKATSAMLLGFPG